MYVLSPFRLWKQRNLLVSSANCVIVTKLDSNTFLACSAGLISYAMKLTPIQEYQEEL